MIERLYLGDFEAAQNSRLLKDRGITHVVNCAIELNEHAAPGVKTLYLNLDDVPEQKIAGALTTSYVFIDDALKDPRARVFVHCYAGISRSSSVVIHYLMRKHRVPYGWVLREVRKRRPIVQPNAGFEVTLKKIDAYIGGL
jgi:atypical dual specificity phosphatase